MNLFILMLEIKSSWNKSHLSEFIVTRERINKFLIRSDISPNYIDVGGKGIELDIKTTNNSSKNPLLTFMFIGKSDKFKFKDIVDLYKDTSWKFLPNLLCLYDKGIIVNINKKDLDDEIFKINLYPEYIENKDDCEWVLLTYNKKRSTLGTLYYIILEHLNTCVLGYPNMINYMQQIFEIKLDNVEFLKDHD